MLRPITNLKVSKKFGQLQKLGLKHQTLEIMLMFTTLSRYREENETFVRVVRCKYGETLSRVPVTRWSSKLKLI